MGTSDLIARFITEMLEDSDGTAELQRSILADRFGCVPSQINYVISTRFSPERGFIVESRRGGGGYIRISRVRTTPNQILMHTVNAVGEILDRATAEALLANAAETGAISEKEAALVRAAVSDQALRPVPPVYRDGVRASIFKYVLVTKLSSEG